MRISDQSLPPIQSVQRKLLLTRGNINTIAFSVGKRENFEVRVRLCNLLEPFITSPAWFQWIHVLHKL